MLLHIQGYHLFQSLQFKNVLQEIQIRFYADFKSDPSFRLNSPFMRPDAHQCLEDSNCSSLHSSGRRNKASDSLQSS